MKELTCFLVLIIMIVIYMNYIRKQLYLSKVKSTINNREYYVRNLKDKQEAADTLARLTQHLLQLLDSIKLLLEEYKDYSLVLSGHSLGGGMCTLFGYLIADKISNNITVISFASPRVGNEKWAKKFNNLKNIRHFRIVNQKDIVTAMPYIGFYHCGNLININSSNKLSFLAFPLCIDTSHLIKTYNPFDHLIENYYDNLECCKWNSDNKYCNSVDVLLI